MRGRFHRRGFGILPRCPTGNQSREGGSVTKVVTIENLLGDQLTVSH